MTTTTDKNIYISREDLTVYKVMLLDDKTLTLHPFYFFDRMTYRLGETYHEPRFKGPTVIEGYDVHFISEGFHCFVNEEDAVNFCKRRSSVEGCNGVVVECRIPNASKTCLGKFTYYSDLQMLGPDERDLVTKNTVRTIVSDAIIPDKIIEFT
jgi:hypothetical protein